MDDDPANKHLTIGDHKCCDKMGFMGLAVAQLEKAARNIGRAVAATKNKCDPVEDPRKEAKTDDDEAAEELDGTGAASDLGLHVLALGCNKAETALKSHRQSRKKHCNDVAKFTLEADQTWESDFEAKFRMPDEFDLEIL